MAQFPSRPLLPHERRQLAGGPAAPVQGGQGGIAQPRMAGVAAPARPVLPHEGRLHGWPKSGGGVQPRTAAVAAPPRPVLVHESREMHAAQPKPNPAVLARGVAQTLARTPTAMAPPRQMLAHEDRHRRRGPALQPAMAAPAPEQRRSGRLLELYGEAGMSFAREAPRARGNPAGRDSNLLYYRENRDVMTPETRARSFASQSLEYYSRGQMSDSVTLNMLSYGIDNPGAVNTEYNAVFRAVFGNQSPEEAGRQMREDPGRIKTAIGSMSKRKAGLKALGVSRDHILADSQIAKLLHHSTAELAETGRKITRVSEALERDGQNVDLRRQLDTLNARRDSQSGAVHGFLEAFVGREGADQHMDSIRSAVARAQVGDHRGTNTELMPAVVAVSLSNTNLGFGDSDRNTAIGAALDTEVTRSGESQRTRSIKDAVGGLHEAGLVGTETMLSATLPPIDLRTGGLATSRVAGGSYGHSRNLAETPGDAPSDEVMLGIVYRNPHVYWPGRQAAERRLGGEGVARIREQVSGEHQSRRELASSGDSSPVEKRRLSDSEPRRAFAEALRGEPSNAGASAEERPRSRPRHEERRRPTVEQKPPAMEH